MKVGTEKQTGDLQKRIPVGNLTSRTLNPSQKWVVYFQSPPKRTRTRPPGSLTESLMILSNMTSGGTWKSKTKYWKGKRSCEGWDPSGSGTPQKSCGCLGELLQPTAQQGCIHVIPMLSVGPHGSLIPPLSVGSQRKRRFLGKPGNN